MDTDFVAAAGPNGHTWNVKRSEADNLMFKHAERSGAKVFDDVRVDSIGFISPGSRDRVSGCDAADPGQAVSAVWSRKDSSSGDISFKHVVDASGRYGLMSCKYLKNRKFNHGLQHIANWGYWRGAGTYAEGLPEEGCPYFEHLQDQSGWVWFIPLHDGTTSVGIVRLQHVATSKKRAMNSPSTKTFYLQTLKDEVPGIKKLLFGAELAEEYIHTASDWSYSASTYASPNVRIAGDAGCFIDPFFSSGVHLALLSGLSAATTIAASWRGDCDEQTAMQWHTTKVQDAYTRFLVVVLGAIRQIRQADENVLHDIDESGFDRAFAHFRPIIQGTADVDAKLTKDEVSKTLEFCMSAFLPTEPEKQKAVLKRLEDMNTDSSESNKAQEKANKDLEGLLSDDEMHVLTTIRAREMVRHEDIVDIDTFHTDNINGWVVNLKKGSLGLVKHSPAAAVNQQKRDVLGLMLHEDAPTG
ncbi:MAG: hypothetical protein M1831_007102 [Alyxoria varia]|nr:MAG: hypothetical protein M1831_007102 [Alyxoria varia]